MGVLTTTISGWEKVKNKKGRVDDKYSNKLDVDNCYDDDDVSDSCNEDDDDDEVRYDIYNNNKCNIDNNCYDKDDNDDDDGH